VGEIFETFHVKRDSTGEKKRFCREAKDCLQDVSSAWNEYLNTEEGGRVGADRKERRFAKVGDGVRDVKL